MVSMPMLKDAEFDLVIQPVSSCYVQDIRPAFQEVARILRSGGLYIFPAQSPVNLQASLASDRGSIGWRQSADSWRNPSHAQALYVNRIPKNTLIRSKLL